jgi:hypothetical protein
VNTTSKPPATKREAVPAAVLALELKGRPIQTVELCSDFKSAAVRTVTVTFARGSAVDGVDGAAAEGAASEEKEEMGIDALTAQVADDWIHEHGMEAVSRALNPRVEWIMKKTGCKLGHLARLCGLNSSQQVGGGKNPDGDKGKYTKKTVTGVSSLVAGAFLFEAAGAPIESIFLLRQQTMDLVVQAVGPLISGKRKRKKASSLTGLKWWQKNLSFVYTAKLNSMEYSELTATSGPQFKHAKTAVMNSVRSKLLKIHTDCSGDKSDQHWYEQLETNEAAAEEEILRVAKTWWLQPGAGALCSKVLLGNWVVEQRNKKRKAKEEPSTKEDDEPPVSTGKAASSSGSHKVLRTEA